MQSVETTLSAVEVEPLSAMLLAMNAQSARTREDHREVRDDGDDDDGSRSPSASLIQA